jgi:hypothetical protein
MLQRSKLGLTPARISNITAPKWAAATSRRLRTPTADTGFLTMNEPLRARAEPVRATELSRGADIDLQAALALARATTRALLSLSPLAHREITDAIAQQIEDLERRGDAQSMAAANLVRQYLPKAA